MDRIYGPAFRLAPLGACPWGKKLSPHVMSFVARDGRGEGGHPHTAGGKGQEGVGISDKTLRAFSLYFG